MSAQNVIQLRLPDDVMNGLLDIEDDFDLSTGTPPTTEQQILTACREYIQRHMPIRKAVVA